MIFAACSRNNKTDATERPIVVASIPPMEYFAKTIGGDRVEVATLASSANDPETYEPTVAQMRKMARARLLFVTGLLPFEQTLANATSEGVKGTTSGGAKDTSSDGMKGTSKVITLSDSLPLIVGTHGHDEADPHIWTSLRNAKIMARTAAAALSEALPEDADYFAHRLDSLTARLDSLDAVVARKLASAAGSSFLVWHPSLSYFARDYDLNQIALTSEHKEVSPTQMHDRIRRVKDQKVNVFFYQNTQDSRQAKTLTEATGLMPVLISPLDADIERTILDATDAITSGSN